MAERVDKLENFEEDLLTLAKLRNNWFMNVENVDDIDSLTLLRRVEILTWRAEIAIARVSVDVAKLEGVKEANTLRLLVAASNPLDISESDEDRQDAIENLMRRNADEWKNALEVSLTFRNDIASHYHDLTMECERIKVDFSAQIQTAVKESIQRVAQHHQQLKESLEEAKRDHRKITAEYLTLRHNARMATEFLNRSHKEATNARDELRSRLDALVREAQMKVCVLINE